MDYTVQIDDDIKQPLLADEAIHRANMSSALLPPTPLSWRTRIAFGAGMTPGTPDCIINTARTGSVPPTLFSNVIGFYAPAFLLETAQVPASPGTRIHTFTHPHHSSAHSTSAS